MLPSVSLSSKKFDELYGKLNPAQKKAVDAIEGPVMVVAGPGTGKTSILTLRIANILRLTDTPPSAILALSFTESGVFAMRKKLVEIVGSAGYKVNISTFHGFCNNLIKEYPEKFPRITGSVPIGDIEQIQAMEKIISEGDFVLLKPFGEPLHYGRPALKTIKELKREGYGAMDLEKTVKSEENFFNSRKDLYHEKGAHKGKMKGEHIKQKERIEKNKELIKIFYAYEKSLAENKFYDYEDMIIEAVKAIRSEPDFLLILQENYQYILADEHQDANRTQNIILELLSNFHQNPNLFIVGDEKQAIFRFQGASLENFLHFKKLYPRALFVNLEENYRSHQGILDGSHSLISKNSAPPDFARVRLKAQSGFPKTAIAVCGFKTDELERFFIAWDISKKIQSGEKPGEIAVIYRENKDGFPIADALERFGIPYQIQSDEDLLRDSELRKLILIFRCIADLSDNEALSKVLFVDFLGIAPVPAFKMIREASLNRIPLDELVKSKFPEFWGRLSRFASLARNKPFVEVFEVVVRESGFLAEVLKSADSFSRLQKLEGFFNGVNKLGNRSDDYFLKDFIAYLNLMENHKMFWKSSVSNGKQEVVSLMTAHKSKGLEFKRVYISGASDGHWGNKTARVSFHLALLENSESGEGKIEDERRLFYVALTRAKESVTITYGREGDGREKLPCQFIGEIDPTSVEIKTSDEAEKAREEMPDFNFKEKKSSALSITEPEFIKNLFLEQGLSVSALNNYLECPWKYFFVSLIRLPQSPSRHQIYGTAVHDTLRIFFNKYREEKDMDRKELLGLFEHNLSRQPLSQSDFRELLQKGRKSLGGYYDTYKNTWNRNLITEFKSEAVIFPLKIENKSFDIILKGRLDKIELLDGDEVSVVDYKTGKAKSRNEILGKTKNADGNYYRQLIFYKMLLSLDPSTRFGASKAKKYEMRSGELDFTEPNEKMRYKKERFDITDKEVAELNTLIAKVASEILTLEFWNKNCEEKGCEYCSLRQQLP